MNRNSKLVTSRMICDSHPDAVLIEDYHAGDMICPECGTVVGDRIIDVGTEWRTFSNSDKGDGNDRCRVGAAEDPLFSGESALSTIIGGELGAAAFDEDGVAKYKNRSSMSSADRSLKQGYSEITRMCACLNLMDCIKNKACVNYKAIRDGKALKGKSNDAVAAACLYIACRQEGVPRSFKEICSAARVAKKEIGRCFKLALKALETNVHLITTGDFMPRFCGNLQLPNEARNMATRVAAEAFKLDVVNGRSPISVAAASIYMVCMAMGIDKSIRDITEISGVAEVTIKQSFKLMLPKAVDLFPSDFQFKVPMTRFTV